MLPRVQDESEDDGVVGGGTDTIGGGTEAVGGGDTGDDCPVVDGRDFGFPVVEGFLRPVVAATFKPVVEGTFTPVVDDDGVDGGSAGEEEEDERTIGTLT